MLNKFRRVVSNIVYKSVEYVENKIDGFVNGTYEELDNLGNMILIMGVFIGLGVKVFANTKR